MKLSLPLRKLFRMLLTQKLRWVNDPFHMVPASPFPVLIHPEYFRFSFFYTTCFLSVFNGGCFSKIPGANFFNPLLNRLTKWQYISEKEDIHTRYSEAPECISGHRFFCCEWKSCGKTYQQRPWKKDIEVCSAIGISSQQDSEKPANW